MNAQQILASSDFKKCEEFHGHVCPGLAIGFRASKIALNRLSEERSRDEEIVAIVETDACSADAVQVLTGCTFGKGNFFFRDYGKMVLTLSSRNSGRSVRVALLSGAFERNEEHAELMGKMMRGEASEAEKNRFSFLHNEKTRQILEKKEEELFSLTEFKAEIPQKARIEPSEACSVCGEPVMKSKMLGEGKSRLCRGCWPLCGHP